MLRPDLCDDLGHHARHWADMAPHTATLTRLASEALSVVEMGTRGGVSTWALLDGLPAGGRMVSADIDPDCALLLPPRVVDDARWSLEEGDSTTVPLPDADLVLIDTSHALVQTRAELARAESLGARAIALHDWEEPGVRQAVCELVSLGGWSLAVEPSQWGLAILRRLP